MNPKINFNERKRRSRRPQLKRDTVNSSFFGSPEIRKKLFDPASTEKEEFFKQVDDSGYLDCSALSTFDTTPRKSSKPLKRDFDSFFDVSSEEDSFASPRCSLFPTFRDLSSSSEESLSAYEFDTSFNHSSTFSSWRSSNTGILSETFDSKVSHVIRQFSPNGDVLSIIGRKIGVRHVDMLSELCDRNVEPVVSRLFSYLSDVDVRTMREVSTTWKSIVGARHKHKPVDNSVCLRNEKVLTIYTSLTL